MKKLWGRDFAVVKKGLAEKDVSDFVEELMARHREVEARLEHIDSLHELATRTLQDAQALAEDIKERAKKETDEYAQEIISKADEQARALVEGAEQQGLSLIRDAKKTERDRLAVRTNSLAQAEDGDLIVGAQELAQRLLVQANANAESKPGSGELTAAQLEHWLAVTPANAGNPAPGAISIAAADDTSNGATESGPVATRRRYPRPTFRWRGVSGATRYALCVFGPPYGMDDIVFLRGDIIGTEFTLPFHLEEGVTYRWTFCGGSATGWGKPFPYLKCTG